MRQAFFWPTIEARHIRFPDAIADAGPTDPQAQCADLTPEDSEMQINPND